MAAVRPSKAAGEPGVTGTVMFMPAGDGLTVRYDLKGLSPNGQHGFHVHEKGDLSDPALTSAGPHFNPGGQKHGGAEGEMRHGGDLGNITADADGNARGEVTATGLTIDDPKTGVVGRSIIVHEKADDLQTDPSGNSGARIAGGTIKAGKSGGASGGVGSDADGDRTPAGAGKDRKDESTSDNEAPLGEKDANNPKRREQ